MVFDLMDTDSRRGLGDDRRPARGRSRPPSTATARTLLRGGRRRPRRGPPAVRRGRRARSAPGPARRAAGTSSPTLVAGADGRRCRRRAARPSCERHAATASEAIAAFGRFLSEELAPRGPGDDAVRPRALRARLALLPRRRGRPRGDLRLGLGGAGADRGRDGRGRRPDRARRLGRRRGRRARRRPGPHASPASEAFRDWMQELADRASPSWPTSTSTSPSRSAASSAGSRRPTTAASTTPARARTSPGPGRMWWSVPEGVDEFSHLARGRPPSSTRACPATTSRSPRRSTAPSCSTAGSG